MTTRPYLIEIRGTQRMIEAAGPAEAVRHAVGADVTVLRPARGSEVAAWVRDKKEIEVAGDRKAVGGDRSQLMIEHQPAGRSASVLPMSPEDAWSWIAGQPGDMTGALTAWTTMLREGRVTLASFDQLRGCVGAFGDAVARNWTLTASVDVSPIGMDDVRAYLADHPLPLPDLLEIFATQIRNERIVAAEEVQAEERDED